MSVETNRSAECRNATITKADLDTERGVLTAWLHLDYGGSGQAFGGYVLFKPEANPCRSERSAECRDCTGLFITRVLEVVGVDSWSKLPGKAIRVRATHSGVEAIGHYLKDKWFEPAKELTTSKGGQDNGHKPR